MMRRTRNKATLAWLGLSLTAAFAQDASAVDVRICTASGAIDIELDDRNAPRHSRNFLAYVNNGFYSGTVFHRVVTDTMVQGGGYNTALERRKPREPVANESFNGLSNLRGTIAASRGDDPDSATSQFFFNLSDNSHLDASQDQAGFTVFGRVTSGLEVLDTFSRLPTRAVGDLSDLPVPPVTLTSVTPLQPTSSFGLQVATDSAARQARFNSAMAGGNPEPILAAIDEMRRNCDDLNSTQFIAEAEAAIALNRIDRARYGLEQYLGLANTQDALRPRAQRLYAGLPAAVANQIDDRIAHCRRPQAPSIPNGRVSDLQALQTAEAAVLRHRQLSELYLTCLAQVIDRGELSEAEAIDATEIYNTMVIESTDITARFNAAVREFKATRF